MTRTIRLALGLLIITIVGAVGAAWLLRSPPSRIVGADGTFVVTLPRGWREVAESTKPDQSTDSECPCWSLAFSDEDVPAEGSPTIVVQVRAHPVSCGGGPGSFGINSSAVFAGTTVGANDDVNGTVTDHVIESLELGSCGAAIAHRLHPTGRFGSFIISCRADYQSFDAHRKDFEAFLASWTWR